ncbi:MAG: SpoIIE family protein phosphatase [Armatimonadota bacterium]
MSGVGQTTGFTIGDESQVGEARRFAAQLAARIGMSDADAGRVALLMTEIGNNLARHARGGELLLRAGAKVSPLLEIVAVDRGPGMYDVSACLRDGFSTIGTPGTGLGAISRQSSEFDLHSVPEVGTTLVARVRAGGPAGGWLRQGVVNLPHKGEERCGDSWLVLDQGDRALLVVADGLGHGLYAAEASSAVVEIVRENPGRSPGELLEEIHAGTRHTRGSAVAIAELRRGTGELRYAGVGNIAGVVLSSGKSTSLVSMNGTVGHQMRKVQEFTYAWPAGALLVMSSDGVSTQWRLDRYPGLLGRDPSLVAAALYRDFNRGRDDLTVLAARETTRS